MLKSFTVVSLLAFAVAAFSAPASAGNYYFGGDGEPYAIAYCNFYKTRAMYAGRKARANPGVRKHRRRAISMWRKYNACLKEHGWPVTYPIPRYR